MPDKTSLFILFGGLVLLAIVVELFVFSLTKPASARFFIRVAAFANVVVLAGIISGIVMEYALLDSNGHLVFYVSFVLGVPFFSMAMHAQKRKRDET
jgi:hypothetical protein